MPPAGSGAERARRSNFVGLSLLKRSRSTAEAVQSNSILFACNAFGSGAGRELRRRIRNAPGGSGTETPPSACVTGAIAASVESGGNSSRHPVSARKRSVCGSAPELNSISASPPFRRQGSNRIPAHASASRYESVRKFFASNPSITVTPAFRARSTSATSSGSESAPGTTSVCGSFRFFKSSSSAKRKKTSASSSRSSMAWNFFS